MSGVQIMRRQEAEVGDRVKHYGQRWTGCATATVVGFETEPGSRWIKVIVQPDNPDEFYGDKRPDGTRAWDWDRTELAPDI